VQNLQINPAAKIAKNDVKHGAIFSFRKYFNIMRKIILNLQIQKDTKYAEKTQKNGRIARSLTPENGLGNLHKKRG